MFESIGILIGIAAAFSVSWLLGRGFKFIAWAILRSNDHRRKQRIAFAASLPPIFTAYMLVCAVAFSFVPGQSELLFGGISEPLPNGYRIEALGKTPDQGIIVAPPSVAAPGSVGFVGSIAVDGSLVLGKDERYFAFNTHNGEVDHFDTLSDLSRYAGHPVRLIELEWFHSPDVSHRRLLIAERWICFGPPLACTAIFFISLLRMRSGPNSAPASR